MRNETHVPIQSAGDIVTARQKVRAMAMSVGFDGSDLTLISTAVSEIARNIITHAERGELVVARVQQGHKRGISVVARDQGPGIPDVSQAMQYGFSTRKGLGVGLPGAKWLMDDFEIESKVGSGTTVTMRKWVT